MPENEQLLDDTDDTTDEVTPFDAWVEKFNSLKGWKKLRVPKGAKGAKRSPKALLRKGVDKASDDAKTAASKQMEARLMVFALRDRLEKASKKDRKEIEKLLEEARVAFADATATVIAADIQLKARQAILKELTELEADLDKELESVGNEINTLAREQRKQDRNGTAPVIDEESKTEFMLRHKSLHDQINQARATPISIPAPDGGLPMIVNSVNTPEYKILFAMLEKALLQFQTGKADPAGSTLDATAKALREFVQSRQRSEKQMSPHPEIDTQMSMAQDHINAVRAAGFDIQAGTLESEAIRISGDFLKIRATTPPSKMGEAVKPANEFKARCEKLRSDLLVFGGIDRQIVQDIAALRSLKQDTAANDFASEWDDRTQIRIESDIEDGRNLLRRIGVALKQGRDSAISETGDPVALRKKLLELKLSYEHMFKHDRHGDRKTMSDGHGGRKGVKKDGSIPREALDEIEIKLLSAEMLLKSNSPEALKTAQGYIDSIAKYETSVQDGSKSFDEIKEYIDEIQELVDRMAGKYVAYEGRAQAEVRIRFDKFKDGYALMEVPAALQEAKAIFSVARRLKDRIQGLHAQFNTFKSEADKLEKVLDEIGFTLKGFKIDDVKLTGYHGVLRDTLREARDKAEGRSDSDLTQATKQVTEARIKAENWADVVDTRIFDGKESLDGPQLGEWSKIKGDAVDGQEKANEAEKLEDEFKSSAKALEKRLDKARDKFKALKLDKAELEGTIVQLDGVKQQAKSSRDFAEALKALPALEKTIEGYEDEAEGLEGFNKLPVDKAAAETVKHLTEFGKSVEEVRKAITSKGGAKGAGLTDGDAGSVDDFLTAVANLMAPGVFAPLTKAANELALIAGNRDKPARAAREAALGQVRYFMRVLDASPIVRRFLTQTFVGETGFGTARQSLNRLEMTLIKALG